MKRTYQPHRRKRKNKVWLSQTDGYAGWPEDSLSTSCERSKSPHRLTGPTPMVLPPRKTQNRSAGAASTSTGSGCSRHCWTESWRGRCCNRLRRIISGC